MGEGKKLLYFVKKATQLEEERVKNSSLEYRLQSKIDQLEKEIKNRLRKGERLPECSWYYLKRFLRKRSATAIPWEEIIYEYLQTTRDPLAESYFGERIEEEKSRKVLDLDYGKKKRK